MIKYNNAKALDIVFYLNLHVGTIVCIISFVAFSIKYRN